VDLFLECAGLLQSVWFWFNMLLYVPWQIIIYICIYRAIKRQPDSELGNAGSRPEMAYA